MNKTYKILLAVAIVFVAFIGGYLFSRFELWLNAPIQLPGLKHPVHDAKKPGQ